MAGEENLRNQEMNLCNEKLMLLGAGDSKSNVSGRGFKIEGGIITEWKDIPTELLLQIVSFSGDKMVIVASGVCRDWRDAICSGLTRLSLSWCDKNMNMLVKSLARKFTNLQILNLRQGEPQLEDDAVETIAHFCHDLQVLDLSKASQLSDNSLYALAHYCPNLTKLNIRGCSFSNHALAYLTRSCRKVKVLNLFRCVKATESDVALQAIGHHCHQLRDLNLRWCKNVTDVGVMSLASGCPDLRKLDLGGCVGITDESVIALANGCPNLRSLGLYNCRKITDGAMYSLANNRAKNRKGLRSLNISKCKALTASAVQALCDSSPALHTCSGRHSLIMSGCSSLTSVHCACAAQAHRRLSCPSST